MTGKCRRASTVKWRVCEPMTLRSARLPDGKRDSTGMTVDDPMHHSVDDAGMRAPADGMKQAEPPDPRFDLLCGLACQMFGMAAATIRVRGTSKVWRAARPAVSSAAGQVEADDARLPAEDGSPVVSLPFGDENAGRFSLFGPPSGTFGASELRQFEQLAALAQEQLRLFTAAQESRSRESEFRLLMAAATDTIVRGRLDGTRLYVSPSIQELLGYSPQELVGRKAIDLTHPDDLPAFKTLMQEVQAGRLKIGRTELRQRHKNGEWVWLEASIRQTLDHDTGQPDGYVTSVRAIGHRKQLEAQLKHLAEVDDLTGLPNRAAFSACLELALERVRQNGARIVLFYMDLDGFKRVNDTLGHAAGDAVLCETATRLQASLRESDRVFRLGGDEFTILSSGSGGSGALALAQRLIAAIARPFGADTGISVGLSVGISCGPEHGQQAGQLLECADRALYSAKKAGKNTARLYDAGVTA